ncbi:MAG: energy transducer TonB [Rhodanobacter sp.]
MKGFKFLAVGLLLAWSMSTQAAPVQEKIYVVGADVDSHGHITATQVDADVPAKLASVLASAVQQWQFMPATRNGQPSPAHTFVRARLQAAPTAGGQYTVTVNYIGNGPKFHKGNVAPEYPRDEARAGRQAFVMLDATVQPGGSLADLTARSRFKDWPLNPAFGRAVVEAARNWHATPEQVDGQPVATHMRVPVTFTLKNSRFNREQTRILRDAALGERSIADSGNKQSAAPFPMDQPVALDSPLQPRNVTTTGNAQ